MLYLVSGSTRSLREYSQHGCFGFLLTPGAGNDPSKIGLPWAGDNGAFSGFDSSAFLKMLRRVKGVSGCLFVAAPDVVSDAEKTINQFYEWRDVIADHGFPVGFVLQDGCEKYGIPWRDLDAVFVGGSTEFKLGRVAESVCRDAKRRGKWSHMGRVNSRKRLRHAFAIGCDSVDGTSATRWADQYLPRYVRWIRSLSRERNLF